MKSLIISMVVLTVVSSVQSKASLYDITTHFLPHVCAAECFTNEEQDILNTDNYVCVAVEENRSLVQFSTLCLAETYINCDQMTPEESEFKRKFYSTNGIKKVSMFLFNNRS